MNIIYKVLERFKHNRRFEVSYLKVFLFARFSSQERMAIRAYKDRHAGGVGVIVANGPSLNEVDFEKVSRFVTIGMNRIYLIRDRLDFKPMYYCLQDHLVAEDNADEINALNGSVMFIPKDLKYCIRNNPNILYTNFIRRYHGVKSKPRFSTDFSERVFAGGTVTFDALQLAYYLGFVKVYIIGLDHSYVVPKDLKGEKLVSSEDDVNHFDPRYFGRGKRWHDPKVDRMERSYWKAKEVFTQAGREVINATPKSQLGEDVFPKLDFSEIPELNQHL